MKIWSLPILFLLLIGCAADPPMSGHCWNNAIYAYGTALANGYEAKMFIQKTSKSDEGIYHGQAAALINGRWVWLQVFG